MSDSQASTSADAERAASSQPVNDADGPSPAGPSDDSATSPRPRRRGSRGGRNRNRSREAGGSAGESEAAGDADLDSDHADPASVGDEKVNPRRRGSRSVAAAVAADENRSGEGDDDKRDDARTGSRLRAAKVRRSPTRQLVDRSTDREARVADRSADDDPARRPRIGDTRPATPNPVAVEGGNAPDGDTPGGDSPDDDTPARRRRRRGGRRRSGAKKPVEAALDEPGPSVDFEEAIELDEETLAQRRGRERNGRPVGRYLMCVQVRGRATQIAVMEGRTLIEHYVSRPHDDASQIDGNVYLSRVQNVLPGMEAAFIDIGTPKNAVLYRGDARYDADEIEGGKKKTDHARIEQMLKGGQVITTQVTKNPIGAKGARLTQEVSLPGRFIVLMPNNSTYGISKRLPDDERKRLRKVLDEVKPPEHGVIVRTAAEGVTADELRRDVQRLLRQWDEIERAAARAKAPALLYQEPDMAVRIIREEFNKNYRGVVIDDPALYEEVRDYVASISPELADRISLFDTTTEPLPIFERFHVHEQLHKALEPKVWLPSGGSLIIERTEALTVIDVNTGKNVGKSNLEETVFRNNLEAAEEIARQLRLRDIGGIIVIDFIDMEIKKNRDEVLERLRGALARDKTRTQAFAISELGLVEMTRKRISEGLVESFSETCETCSGRGFILDDSLLEN